MYLFQKNVMFRFLCTYTSTALQTRAPPLNDEENGERHLVINLSKGTVISLHAATGLVVVPISHIMKSQ